MNRTQSVNIEVVIQGSVPDGMRELATAKIGSLLRFASAPVLFARVTLAMARDPAVERPATVQVTVDLNGRPVRVQSAAATMRDAIEQMAGRLRVRLEKAGPRDRLHDRPKPNIRRRSRPLWRRAPDEAMADLELLEHDFQLFIEPSSGQDSVLYRTEDGYRLALLDPQATRPGPMSAAITLSEVPAPHLTPSEAALRLEATGAPFQFFADADTGRGNIIYHRYDGDYGLIVPAGTAE